MNYYKTIILIMFIFIAKGLLPFSTYNAIQNDLFVSYIVDIKKQNIHFYWKNEKQVPFKSISNLKYWVNKKNEKLLFATNGGMYKKNNIPKGLFIENQNTLTPIDTGSGDGNFYLKPNGVFYITTNNTAVICNSINFNTKTKIKYATQSGPLLLINGQINPAFNSNSININIRNGVGILPNNKVVFAMSKKEINFYTLAIYFKSMGCKEALYLDGFVSRTYLPEKNWLQTDGDFAVIIAVTEK